MLPPASLQKKADGHQPMSNQDDLGNLEKGVFWHRRWIRAVTRAISQERLNPRADESEKTELPFLHHPADLIERRVVEKGSQRNS